MLRRTASQGPKAVETRLHIMIQSGNKLHATATGSTQVGMSHAAGCNAVLLQSVAFIYQLWQRGAKPQNKQQMTYCTAQHFMEDDCLHVHHSHYNDLHKLKHHDCSSSLVEFLPPSLRSGLWKSDSLSRMRGTPGGIHCSGSL